MDTLAKYRQIIKEVLSEYAQYKPINGDIENIPIFDETHDRYQLVSMGWEGKKRVYGCVMHIDIKADKVWLQNDNTDANIAQELVMKGIPQTQIVLGFQPEHYRSYTGFAVM